MNSWTSCHTAFFFRMRSKTLLYFTFLTYVPIVAFYRRLLFGFFSTFCEQCEYPSMIYVFIFSRLRVETHCDIVNVSQELAQNQALSSWSVECLVSSTNNERSICKSHWVHSKMNDFNNNKTFLNWKVTEWTRLTRLGRLTFRELVNLIRFAFRVKSNQQGSWWTSRKGWISG